MKKPVKTKETVRKGGQTVLENTKTAGSGGTAATADKEDKENG